MTFPLRPSLHCAFLPADQPIAATLEPPLALLMATDAPFDDQLPNDLGRISLDGGEGVTLSFGADDSVRFGITGNASFSCALRLKRAANEKLDELDDYLPPGLDFRNGLIIALTAAAEGGISAQSGTPLGSYLALKAGSQAGGGLHYRCCRPYGRRESARAILTDFLSSLRWPLAPATAARAADPRDVCAVEFRGRLTLWGKLSLGYSVSGSKGIAVKDLETSFCYDVQAALRWGGRIELGGSFCLVSSGGSRAGWTRLRVRRARHQTAETHFGLDLKVGYEATGLPADPSGLLTALTGYDPKNVLGWLEAAAGADDLDDALALVKERFGARAARSAGSLLDRAFRSTTFAKTQAKVARVLEAYSTFTDEIDSRLVDLARRHLDSPETRRRLGQILALSSREALRGLSDSAAWVLIDEMYGDSIHTLLSDQKTFAAFREKAARLHALLEGRGSMRPLRDFMACVAERFNVDALVAQLADGLDAEKLKALAAGKLGDLAGILFEFTREELKGPAVDAVVQRVSGRARDLLGLKKKLARALEKGLANRLEVSLTHATRRSQSSGELVDVEFNLETEQGRALYDLARQGDFLAALRAFDPAHVLVHRGEFQEALASSRRLQVHAFGWTNSFEIQLDQVSEIEAVMQDGGPVFLLSSETAQTLREVSGFDQKESVQSILQLGIQGRAAAGAGSRDDVLVQVIESMRCSCEVLREVDTPAWEDLPKAFRLAHQLGIVAKPEALVAGLKAEFGPMPPRRVSLRYSVGYNPAAFEALWERDFEAESDDRAFVSQTFRSLLMDRWSFDHPGFFAPETMETYLRHHRIARLKSGSVKNKRWRYVAVAADGAKINLNSTNDVLYRAYMAETAFLKALELLDDACDQARSGGVNWTSLNNAVAAFLAVPKDGLAFSQAVWKGNLFFLTLDAMLLAQSGDARAGRTLLQLDLTPHSGDPIRRFY